MNPPSDRAIGAAKLHTGTAGAVPFASFGWPLASNSCHASEPPRAHAVPSVHTNSTSPFAFVARRGCLRAPASPGAAVGFGMRAAAASISPKYTCPAVSHAPSRREPDLAIDMLVIGHAPMF